MNQCLSPTLLRSTHECIHIDSQTVNQGQSLTWLLTLTVAMNSYIICCTIVQNCISVTLVDKYLTEDLLILWLMVMYGWQFWVKAGQGTGTLFSPVLGSLDRRIKMSLQMTQSLKTIRVWCVHAWSTNIPSPGKVGPVCNHIAGQVSVSGEVDQWGGVGFTKQVLQVLSMLCFHPARESWDTSLHVEQIGESTCTTGGQTENTQTLQSCNVYHGLG